MFASSGEGSQAAGWLVTTIAAVTVWLAVACVQCFLRFHGVIGDGVPKVLPSGRRVGLPPGRMGLPLLGETFPFVRSIRTRGLRDQFILPRRQLNGATVFKTHAMGVPMVVVSGPEAHKLVLGGEYTRVDTMLFKSMRDVLGVRSVVNALGDVHKYLRRMLVDPMGPLTMKKIAPRVEEFVIQTLLDWEAKEELSAYEASRKFTYGVILDVLLSVTSKEGFQKYFSNIERVVPGAHNVPLMIPGTPYYKAMKARRDMHTAIDAEIAWRRKLEHWQWPKDVLSHMMAAVDEDGEKFSVADLKDTVVTMMFAGYDTTSTTLACLIEYVYRHPHVLRRLQEENDALRADLGPEGALSWEAIKGPKMHYTHMVIQETHRHLSLAYAILRFAKHDMEYDGFLIPKGWYVLLDLTSTHHDPAIFENPSRFNPSRFEKKSPPFSFTPFGLGPRACVGQELASMELVMFLHHLVTKYSWVVTAENQGIDFGPSVGKPRNKVPIRIQRRC